MNRLEEKLPPRRVKAIAGLAATISAAWLFVLSGLFGVVPGSVMTKRVNVLFASDCSVSIQDYVADSTRGRTIHPLISELYRRPIHWCYNALTLVLPEAQAAVYAGRAYNAVFGALGIACAVYSALRRGLRLAALVPLLFVTMLSTSMILVAVPEHFGVSYGMLALTFAVAAAELRFSTTLFLLGLLAVVASGLSLTNGLFPLATAALVIWRQPREQSPKRILWPTLIAVAIGIAGLGAFVASSETVMNNLRGKILPYLNMRLRDDPVKAGAFAFRGFIDPVIGPTPAIDGVGSWKRPMVTYEPGYAPYRIWPYDLPQSAAAACWITLLLLSGLSLIRSQDRLLALLLLGWIGFNLVFHNIWGDEFFLFSPHWSWALTTIVLLGMRHYPSRWIILLCLPIIVGQIVTLTRIWAVLAEIQS